MTVYLVGAGPGDPGLITVRGLELVRSCDVLVFDRLVSAKLVAEAPASALRIPRHGLRQDTINHLLVLHGGTSRVVRLKGGDPFVFGRGGEEALALACAGIPFEVVPGVSCVSAVPAAAGIPVTHRGAASQVTIVTAQTCDGTALDYAGLAAAEGTLVFFMGLEKLEGIVDSLLHAGKPPTTPAAVVARGTLPEQRTVTARLECLVSSARDAQIDPPAVLVVGEVVSLRHHLGYEMHAPQEEADDARAATASIQDGKEEVIGA